MQTRGQYLFVNQELTLLPDFTDIVNPNEISAYEVIRVINGVPLFLKEHLLRLKNSAELLSIKLNISFAEVARQIQTLAQKNETRNGNVKLISSANTSKEGSGSNVFLFFIPHHYPTSQEYQKGYTLKSMILERPQPNAKSVSGSFSRKLNELDEKENIDEILLVRNDGIITEGSRSNIFFIRQNQIFTPPQQRVLPGITRNKIIELCQDHNISCRESEIKYVELGNMEAAFITGTSPKVMPVNKIDEIKMEVNHPLIKTVIGLYDAILVRKIHEFSLSPTATKVQY